MNDIFEEKLTIDKSIPEYSVVVNSFAHKMRTWEKKKCIETKISIFMCLILPVPNNEESQRLEMKKAGYRNKLNTNITFGKYSHIAT